MIVIRCKVKQKPKSKEEQQKPGEIFVPPEGGKAKPKGNKSPRKFSKEITPTEQEIIAKLTKNISLILNERLNHNHQEDLEFLINRGFLDESQGLTLFQ